MVHTSRRRTNWGLVAAALLLAAAGGCGGSGPSTASPPGQNGAPTAPGGSNEDGGGTAAAAASPPVTVKSVDAAGLQKVLDQLRDEKKVVLVDFWGTWCDPCKKRFPHTVELASAHAAEGLAVVSVALEYDPAQSREEVVQFLTDQKATFTNLISDAPLDEAIGAFGIDGNGLPHFRVYGRDGALVKKFLTDDDPDNSFSDADIDEAVKGALAGKPAEAQP